MQSKTFGFELFYASECVFGNLSCLSCFDPNHSTTDARTYLAHLPLSSSITTFNISLHMAFVNFHQLRICPPD